GRGASIDDPSGRLETSGEVMAHTKLREAGDVDRALFADWLRARARSSGGRVGRRARPAGRVEAEQIDDVRRGGGLGRAALVVGPDLLALAVPQAEDPQPAVPRALEELEGEVGRVEEAAGTVEHARPARVVLALDLVHLARAGRDRRRS